MLINMANEVGTLQPRHLEIMRRLVLGQRQVDIAQDMGITQSRLSIIVNSPLFQLNMRELQNRRNENIIKIQDELIEAGLKGVRLHNRVICDNEMPIETRQRSATSVLNIVGRVVKTEQGGSSNEGSDQPYERRLKEVILREEVTSFGPQPGEGEGELETEEPETIDLVEGVNGNGDHDEDIT